jgi:hypothetical protein
MIFADSHRARWCVVVADDHGPEWAPAVDGGTSTHDGRQAPVQYSRLGESCTLLQRAMHRAARIAPASQVMVTALDEYREHWEPALWFVRPENRFVCENRAASLLTGAAALLSVAQSSPSNVVTILPARCFASQGWILDMALDRARSLLPGIREGAVTLGMVDIDEAVDEDYLVASRADAGGGLMVQGYARRPAAWVARRLKQQGALVASGIMVGYAGVFAAHVSRCWPGLTLALMQLTHAAAAARVECEVPLSLQRGVPNPVLRSLRWSPPAFAQRALRVGGAGWSGLKSPRAVARITEYLAAADGSATSRQESAKVRPAEGTSQRSAPWPPMQSCS